MIIALLFRTITGQSIAYDLPVSVLYSVAMSFQCLATWYGQVVLFDTLIRGAANLGENAQANRIVSMTVYVGLAANFLYLGVIITGVSILGSFIAPGPTPARIALVAVRNIGTVLYFGMFAVIDNIQESGMKKLIANASGRENSPLKEHYMKTLNKLEINVAASVRRIFLLIVLCLVFTVVPQLFPFNYVFMALMLGLAAGKNHFIFAYESSTLQSSASDRASQSPKKSSTIPVGSAVGNSLSALEGLSSDASRSSKRMTAKVG